MAKSFDAVDDVITFTGPAVSGSYTFLAWCYPKTAGENNGGRIIQLGNATVQLTFCVRNQNAAPLNDINCFVIDHTYTGATNARCSSADSSAKFNQWQCIVGTSDSGSQVAKLYWGDLSTAMAEMSYKVTETGAGTRGTSDTDGYVGNRNATDRTFDGYLAAVAWVPWIMTVAEMERYRNGDWTVLFDHGAPYVFFPLDSPTASQAEDLSGNGRNGTVTNGPTVVEGPPIASGWGGQVMAALGAAGTQFNQTLSATVTSTATIVKSAGKILSATSTQTPSFVRSVGKILSGTSTTTPTLVKSVGKLLSATSTQTATMTRAKIWALVLSVTSSAASTIVRSVGKVLSTTSTQTASFGPKTIGKIVTAACTQVPSLVATASAHLYQVVMSVTSTATPQFVKTIGKTLTAATKRAAVFLFDE